MPNALRLPRLEKVGMEGRRIGFANERKSPIVWFPQILFL